MLLLYFAILCRNGLVSGYSNNLFTITKSTNPYEKEDICFYYENNTNLRQPDHENKEKNAMKLDHNIPLKDDSLLIVIEEDPYESLQSILHTFLFGENNVAVEERDALSESKNINNFDKLLHYPSGNSLRKAELFENKAGVHLPMFGLMHTGYCLLNITDDYMQTAVDAFAIFVNGRLDDVERLPADYVLRSVRTISMMKISNEKLAATWRVVKGDLDPIDVTYETLEQYRPLFKYLNGKEIARLNLMDPRILNYIGTHPDLDRHQVGVVASKYIKLNSRWTEPKYLNLMNNLICGVPMTFMRKIPENTFLQLSHQVFYHTRACDALQRRFYLVMMTKAQALGKAYSWNAQDVSRLGILLADVEGPDLGSIKPEALVGLTAQVMMEMKPENLQFLTTAQMKYISDKALNIMAKKLREYQDQNNPSSSFRCICISNVLMTVIILINI